MKDNENQLCAEKFPQNNPTQVKPMDIAVIGMACRFPGAQNYEEFWKNLEQRRSSIQEIPLERWDWKALWGDPQTEINKSNSKWAGFIEDVDAFDTGFFCFSPREAEAMDPQQRIMLELSWACLEDAGICPSKVSGKKVGVFIGVFNFDYKELQEKKFRTIETYHSTGTASAVIANRVSHYFNLKGPSFPIDAACSSSLTAIHTAVQSLNSGECAMALAGGINLLLTPTRHISFSKTGMLSPTGSCKTFDKSADGYVRGEGAGLIFLKPLEKAIEDGDSIYGILKGSAINHNGKTHTLTYPNPDAQAEVIIAACKQARVTPESISYIETHGTGTPKGDPIEIQGLLKAFANLSVQGGQSVKRNYCGLGSVKTNVGHLEAAAGVAGVIKVLLSMKYKKLPALQNFKQLNHRIAVENSPFYFIDQLQEWKTLKDENNQAYPRRAGVSSFGFGGTNSHVVIEEVTIPTKRSTTKARYYLICLSAKTQDALRRKEEDLLDWLAEKGRENELIDISATLLLGREHFEIRSAFVVKDIQELQEKLKQVLEKGEAEGYFTDNNKGKQIRSPFTELGKTIIKALQTNKLKDEQEYVNRLMALAELYATGHNLDWKMILPDGKTHRINLPTYPFARERYWIPDSDVESYGTLTSSVESASIHPLLQHNTSDLSEQRFSSKFTGKEFFLRDHVVKGQRVLPGVAYLEMARAAVEQSAGVLEAGQSGILLKNVVWTRPIAVGEQPVQVHIGLYPEDNGDIVYEVYSEPDGAGEDSVVHSQGIARLGLVAEAPTFDLFALQAHCTKSSISSRQCYKSFSAVGFDYGPGHRGIENIYVGQDQLLAKLSLPSTILDTKDQFILHPSLMDAALQASLMINSGDFKLALPCALQELEIFGKCTPAMWTLVRYSNGSKAGEEMQKLDIDLCDEHGNVCVRMKGLKLQESTETVLMTSLGSNPQSLPVSEPQETFEMMTFEEVLQEQTQAHTFPVTIKTMLCFLSHPENQQAIVEAMQTLDQQTRVIFISQSTTYQKQSPQEYYISRSDGNSYQEAFRSIREEYGEVDAILYLWTLEDPGCVQDYASIVYILQAIAAAKLKANRCLLAAPFSDGLERCYLESWIGFERSLGLVLPTTQVAAILQGTGKQDPATAMKDWLQKLWAELQADKAQNVLYQERKRYVYKVQPTTIKPGSGLVRSGGTYLITGGCGGLGFLFAEHFAKKHPVNLILTGRSPINAEKQAKIKALENLGSQVLYVQADVCELTRMREGLNRAKERFGGIHGVIHAAGIEDNQSVLEKDISSFEQVLAPKIKGTLMLDETLQEEALEFVCYFSSSSALLGDFGACDYAVGNRFQMAYAHYRNQEQRQGRAFVINWPLWQDGGMSFGDDENTKMYLKSSGQRFLETEEGVAMFDCILSQTNTQHLVLVGQRSRVHRFLGLIENRSVSLTPAVSNVLGKGRRPEMKGLSMEQCLEWDLKEHISKLLKIPRDKLHKEENLADFGFDSINLAQFATLLTNHYGMEITPALFFGHSTIEKLTQYFFTEHRAAIQEFYKEDAAKQDFQSNVQAAAIIAGRQGAKKSRFTVRSTPQTVPEPIAIIGMSGRFPEARNIDELWKILVEERDMVKEAPADRLFGPEIPTWRCGWIPGVSEFDPLFFEMSPREAEIMDPRQRLLLQEAWKALEDAGYGAAQIKSSRIGMFVGVEEGNYQQLIKEKASITSNHNGILASRLAYFLNLKGPVMAINTACSSGLVAAHQAVLSLRNRECDTAIAAGVNLMLTPDVFILMSQAGMLSEGGKCFTFDKRANGMVPGEAVAAVVLKRLSQAEADGDSIYAVVTGSGINYDGKTNGITAPSGVAQTDLLKSIYDQYQINPEEIEYIVTHGTGTKLGDPVEINALYSAFKYYTKKQGYCALTSTKTNFGHTLAPSGLVSLISLVQALRHETIPASLHCEQENDYINWQSSPFYVNKTSKSWPEKEGKRRTGAVSAYGMSGTNAHMVVQSYITEEREASQDQAPCYLLTLSAKTNEALQEKIKDMIDVLENKNWQKSLAQISYTLLEGRQHFNHRCAIVVQDREDAVYLLKQVESNEKIPNLFQGKVPRNFSGQKVMEEYAQDLLKQSWLLQENKKKYQEILCGLADLYCQGYELPWNLLFGEPKPRRISLPPYPFTREQYWISDVETRAGGAIKPTVSATIHPLLHQNTSDLSEQRFSSTFTGQEFFLADHVVKGQRVLPGVAYLEMARAAVEQAAGSMSHGRTGIRLKNVVWARPIAVGEQPVQVHIGLFPEDNGEINYDIYSKPEDTDEELIVHSQGSAVLRVAGEVPTLELQVLQAQCNQQILSSGQCYEVFKSMKLEYGPGHQGIEKLYVGQRQVLAKLSLPSSVSATQKQFGLHPSLMDAALQALVGFMMVSEDADRKVPLSPALPFALQELEILDHCTSVMWAVLRYSADSKAGEKVQKFDIDLCDEQGNVCVRMKGFSLRKLEGEVGSVGSAAAFGTLMLEPCWQERAVAQNATPPDYSQHLVILCEPGDVTRESIETQINGAHCLILQSEQESIEERFHTYALQAFEEIQSLLKEKATGKVLVQIVVPNQGERQLFSGLSGLLKTAQLENPKFSGQLIEVQPGQYPEAIAEILKENRRSYLENHICYQDNKRYVAGWSEVEAFPETVRIPWKAQGVYLITGGAGGLGLIFAKEIVHKVKDVTLILTGRSSLTAEKLVQLKELEALGARIEYKQVDVTKKQAVADLIQNIQENFGRLHGIIHSAGIIRDNFILKKTKEELQAVLEPKVSGLVNLDQASKDLKLDFFVLFSSSTGALGNLGQADYATANAFMDAYARYRNSLVVSKQRQGQTLSMNWPLWQEGGMYVDQETEKLMMQNIGMIAMQTLTGIRALYQGLAFGKDQVIVVEGDVKRLHTALLEQPSGKEVERAPSTIEENKVVPAIGQDVLQQKATHYFKKLLSSVIKLPTHRIEADAPLEKYGIDSIMVMQLTNQLEKTFGSLSKTLFFEYQNIKDLTGYFLEAYRKQLTELLGIEEKAAATTETFRDSLALADPVESAIGIRKRSRFASLRIENPQERSGASDIAIIGVAGRYPQAGNIRQFWQNLRDGKDCITEIPRDRWDHSLYFDADKNKPGKTYSKWGGFVDGVDLFDPLFFNISPREAEIMDPQERLFLECVYETLEDAGYTREALGSYQGFDLAGNVGVYVGVMYEEYQLYGAQEQLQGRQIALAGNPSSIANRVSYFCNFHGPSMAVDTMCSSSLTAIHLACQSLQQGGCQLAIAGGVNVSIHPNKYLMLAQGKFVSSKGRCESFGQGGDGYVPGEGVGAVLLKPLSKAIADRDNIYGIIKGTAVNHGGKTNGYSVPNPNAQASVIGRAFREAGINPRTVSYIEAHGTGTSLGDPIEMAGLTKAFEEYTVSKQFCAIGSAKSNIGHCESAAGIAGLTKLLLQLRHRQLVPSLHSEVLNPNIDFSNTPFTVQQELVEWKRPMVEINGETKEYPRIAGISSFGAGGSNAHIVIEEYIPKEQEQLPAGINPQNPAIIVLSAKNEERLKEQVRRFLALIQEQQFTDDSLADIAYTLQVGREAMEERLGLVVESIEELEEKLQGFATGLDSIENLYRGQVKRNKETMAVFTADEDLQKAMDAWITKGKYAKLLDLWVKGLVFDWNKLYGDTKPRRISLHTYPFAKERYWVPKSETKYVNGSTNPTVSRFAPARDTEKVILKKEWQQRTINTKAGEQAGIVVVLGTTSTAQLASALFEEMEAVQVIQVIHDENHVGERTSTNLYSISAGEHLYQQIKDIQKGQKLLGVVDITAYDPIYEQSVETESGKITFLQKMIEHDRHEGYKILQVTHRLHAFQLSKTTLQGARMAGLYRMLGAEYKQIKAMTMDSDCSRQDYETLAKQIEAEFFSINNENLTECCYRNNERYEPWLKISQTNDDIKANLPFKESYEKHEVVLITGGSRGIGAAIGEHVVARGVKNLVIMGREDLPEPSEWKKIIVSKEKPELAVKLKGMQSLMDRGARIRYYNTPLTDEAGIKAMVQAIRQDVGRITGVFHCAGLASKDPAFFKKPITDFEAVCEPKMKGLVTLHRALAEAPLEFFILFSSIASIVPILSTGQSDYAMANAYMDYYALNQAGEGKTYFKSIQWPAWGETGGATGGMRTPAYSKTGLVSHTTADGLAFLDIIKNTPYIVSLPCVVVPGEFTADQLLKTEVVPSRREINVTASRAFQQEPETTPGSSLDLRISVIQWLKQVFTSELKLTLAQLDEGKPFYEYGVESIMLAQLTQILQKRVGQTLDPALLLEHSTISALADYFMAHHAAELQRSLKPETDCISINNAASPSVNAAPHSNSKLVSINQPIVAGGPAQSAEDIAVVGLSCRFPGSPTKEAYWELLTKGVSVVRPVPKERWIPKENRQDYGGWIEDIDLFDPQFFNISEHDAAIMDPQARIILEESLRAIYDAGYEHKQLSGQKIGVFIGGRSQPNLNINAVLKAPNPILGMGQNYLATNISRFFNFKGPSLVVDTACSSGITGMMFACDSLREGRIDMGLVGAVNVLATPYAHDLFAARNILSKSGEFHIFDRRSDGEVLGEGAGVVLLKRLRDAITDGNQIYGVIKAIAENNDGQTLGPGSPNMNAQKQVMQDALTLSGKQPAEIRYIEVNGGGSPVVDSIEIKALSEVYDLGNQALASCVIGSVKPNIGHLLLTSGLAGFIRCVLSVHHKQIPPFLSASEAFTYYDFSSSRIDFNRETIEWRVDPGKKRLAAQNSFPDGGTNCHLLIEEFVSDGIYQQQYFSKEAPKMTRKRFPLHLLSLLEPVTTTHIKDLPEKYAGTEMHSLKKVFNKKPGQEEKRQHRLSDQSLWGGYHEKSI